MNNRDNQFYFYISNSNFQFLIRSFS